MLPYLLILALAWFLASLIEKYQATDPKLALKYKYLLIAALTAFVGLRYNVGSDYSAYVWDYERFLASSYSQIITSKDPSLKLLAKLGSLIYDSPTTMFMLAAIVFTLIYINSLYENSIHFSLAILLFFVCGTYLDSCGGVRQALAAAVIFSGFKYVKERQLLKYFLIILLACSFHSSAIVMLPLYLILSCPSQLNKVFWLAIITITILIAYSGLFSIAESITGKAINLDNAYFSGGVNLFRVAVAVAPCVLIPFLRKESSVQLTPYINLVILNAMLMCVTAHSIYLARVGIYTTAFLPLALPPLLYNLQLGKNSIRGIRLTMLAIPFFGLAHNSAAISLPNRLQCYALASCRAFPSLCQSIMPSAPGNHSSILAQTCQDWEFVICRRLH